MQDPAAEILIIHPAEIETREFPRGRGKRGIDRDAVRAWLRSVAAAYRALEEECERLRGERDRTRTTLHAVRERRHSPSVRAALMSAKLRKRPFGYSKRDVEPLLSSLIDELARLETRAALLESEASAARPAARPDVGDRIERLALEIADVREAVRRAAPDRISSNGHGPGRDEPLP